VQKKKARKEEKQEAEEKEEAAEEAKTTTNEDWKIVTPNVLLRIAGLPKPKSSRFEVEVDLRSPFSFLGINS
jgi:hypothetical protein